MQGKARTDEQKLELFRGMESYFKLGYSLNKASKLAGIPSSTAHDIINSSELLRIKMVGLQNSVTTQARQNVVTAITEQKDVALSRWWLERKEADEFKSQQKIEADVPFLNLADLRRAKEERNAKQLTESNS